MRQNYRPKPPTKDYTSTLMRIAGNIAAGFAGHYMGENGDEHVCRRAVLMAKQIIALCRDHARHESSKNVTKVKRRA